MRTFTLFFLLLVTSLSVSAQAFIIEEPSSVAGPYLINGANFGPDLLDTVWCGELALVEPADGCNPISTDLTDKIAVIDRGSCNFSIKIYNAQLQGAVGVIIANNVVGETFEMGAGTNADLVTIPSVFIKLEDADILKAAMGDQTLNGCMGNIVFDNDLAASISDVTAPYNATIPASQITDENSASFLPEARVLNKGTNPLSNVSVNLSVDYTAEGSTSSTNLFDESKDMSALLGVDSIVSVSFDDPYDYSQSAEGVITLTYTFDTDSLEEQLADNVVTSDIYITDNVYCKGGWDLEDDNPVVPISFTTQDGGTIEFLTGFDILKGDGFRLDSVKSFVSISADDAPTLEDVAIEAKIYAWDDDDEDDNAISDEITLVASGTYTFDENATSGEFFTIPIDDILSLEDGYVLSDDTKIFVGLRYVGDASVFFGFDNTKSFSFANDAGYTDPTNTDLPYFFTTAALSGTGVPDFDGGLQIFGNSQDHLACGVYINAFESSVATLTDDEAKVELFPNPASTFMTTKVNLDELTSKLEYNIYDMQGRMIFSVVKNNIKEDINEFNIEQLPAGVYNLNITTDKGIKTERFNVQR
ncbi:MAG: PA domain-containing protein [Saprospiraceae bacterium]